MTSSTAERAATSLPQAHPGAALGERAPGAPPGSASEGRRAARRLLKAGLAAAFALAPHAGATTLAHEETLLARSQPKDRTLHHLQAGVLALQEAKLEASERHFDAALESIESVFSNAENAAKARSLWYEEGAKDFKGEPYERAMAFYYRGLLYLIEADYENARASFRGALMQSAFAEEQQYRSGFATLMFLEGWANQLLGDAAQAAEAYAEARQYRRDWAPPAAGANTLVIAELAGSPRKVGDGIGNHEIVYRRARRTPERRIAVALDGAEPKALYAMEDLFMQATHRGPRQIDRIIDGKVAFQTTTAAVGETAGTIANEAGLISASVGGSGGAALGGLAAIGAIASLVATNVKPRADVRYWANLPETLHIGTFASAALPKVTFSLSDESGQPVAVDGVVTHRWTDRNGNRLVWIKTRR